jgi:hypothetical protein
VGAFIAQAAEGLFHPSEGEQREDCWLANFRVIV